MNVIGNLPLGVVLRDGTEGAPALTPDGKIPLFVLGKCTITGEDRKFRMHYPARVMPTQEQLKAFVESALRHIVFIEARPWGSEDAHRILFPVQVQHTKHDAKLDLAKPDPRRTSLLISRPLGGRSLLKT